MKKYVFLGVLFFTALSWSQLSWANCAVTLKVVEKREIVALSHGGNPPAIHTVVLKPSNEINNSDACKSYFSTSEFHMNNVGQHDKAFQDLEMGDIVKGTLNYHRPSPYGKSLNSNFHHGFRLLKSKDIDYSQQYIYFRHIGLY